MCAIYLLLVQCYADDVNLWIFCDNDMQVGTKYELSNNDFMSAKIYKLIIYLMATSKGQCQYMVQ